jgi:hypothetical protein
MTGKFLTEIDASEAGNLIAPVFASKGVLDASGYNMAGGFAYAAGAGYVRDASAWRQLMFRDGAGGADFIPVSDSSGVYQAVSKSTFLSGYVTGSGVANRLALWSGSGTLTTDSGLTWDIGEIKVSNPGIYGSFLKLNINNNSVSSTNQAGIVISETGTPIGQFVAKRDGSGFFGFEVLYPNNRFDIRQNVGGTPSDILTVGGGAYAGRIGIKQAFPNSDLTVNGSFQIEPFTTNGNVITHNGIGETQSTPPSTIVSNGGGVLGAGQNGAIPIWIGANTQSYDQNIRYLLSSGGGIEVGGGSYGGLYKTSLFGKSTAEGILILGNNGDNDIRGGRDFAGGKLNFYTNNTAGPTVASDGILALSLLSTGQPRFPYFSSVGTVITDASGNLSSAAHYDYSGTLSAARSMTLGSYSFTFDASGAASSPGTMLILKGKETSFTTRFLDYQNESGTTSFRMSATSTQVTAEAQNSHNLRIGGVTQTILSTGSDKNVTVHTDGWMSLHSGLSAHPSTTPSIAAKWYLNGEFYCQNASGRRQFATVEDDIVGTYNILATNHTASGSEFTVTLDANSGAITETLGTGMVEGKWYTFDCRRNATNNITFQTANSCVIKLSGSSSWTQTTVIADPHYVYAAKRIAGTLIIMYRL